MQPLNIVSEKIRHRTVGIVKEKRKSIKFQLVKPEMYFTNPLPSPWLGSLENDRCSQNGLPWERNEISERKIPGLVVGYSGRKEPRKQERLVMCVGCLQTGYL